MMKKSNSSEEVASPPAKSPSPAPTPSPPPVHLDVLPSRSTRSTRKAGVDKKESKKIEEDKKTVELPKTRSTRKTVIEQKESKKVISPPARSTRDSLPIAESPTRNTRRRKTHLKFSDESPAEEVKKEVTLPPPARSKRVKKVASPQEVESEIVETKKAGRGAKKVSSEKRVTRSTRNR